MHDLISVIVTVYNVEAYLNECIDSILKQTYHNLEIILVDDGSTDHSVQICDEYAKKDARILVIHKKNEGLVRARKTGIQAATGKYVGYVDADDWIEPVMYERIYKYMRENNADIVTTGRIEEYPDKTFVCKNKIEQGLYSEESLEKLYSRMIFAGSFFEFGVFPTVWDKLFRRELLFRNQMQVPDEIVVGEDVACSFPCMLEASKIYVSGDCFYHYRKRNGSMLLTVDKRYNNRVKILQQYMYKRCEKSKYWEIIKRQIDIYIMDMVLNGACLEYNFQFAKEIGNQFLFPFQLVEKRAKVVLYGAGNVGKEYYRQIIYSHYCEIVLWVDKKADKLSGMPYRISRPEKLMDMDYDQIIICVMDAEIAESIRMELKSQNIEDQKIVWKDPVFL